MAKKKTKNKKIGKYSLVAITFLTVITIIMAFLANVKYTPVVGDAFSVSGFETMFGWKGEKSDVNWSSFSFMALLAYALPIIGLVLTLIFSKSKALTLIPLACFVAGAILMFIMPSFVKLTDAGQLITLPTKSSLAYGAIIAGIMNILSALAVAIKILMS